MSSWLVDERLHAGVADWKGNTGPSNNSCPCYDTDFTRHPVARMIFSNAL